MSTFDEWITDIRPVLQRITWGSRCLRTDAAMLRERPQWETVAEYEMAEAEKELTAALDRVRMARAVYRAKPVEPEQYLEMQAAE